MYGGALNQRLQNTESVSSERMCVLTVTLDVHIHTGNKTAKCKILLTEQCSAIRNSSKQPDFSFCVSKEIFMYQK